MYYNYSSLIAAAVTEIYFDILLDSINDSKPKPYCAWYTYICVHNFPVLDLIAGTTTIIQPPL